MLPANQVPGALCTVPILQERDLHIPSRDCDIEGFFSLSGKEIVSLMRVYEVRFGSQPYMFQGGVTSKDSEYTPEEVKNGKVWC